MNRKVKYVLKYGFTALGLISVSVGTTIGIILPKTLKLKEGLENFVVAVPGQDPYRSWAHKKLFYVALGDSITTGFNGTLGRDSYSYADFLANNLRNSNRLAGYKNFAHSNDIIFDSASAILRDTSKSHVLKKADIISITIGSNDLLTVTKFLEIGFRARTKELIANMFSSKIGNQERYNVNINQGLNDIEKIDGKEYPVGQANLPLNNGEKFYILRKSIHKFIEMYKTKDFHGIISIQPLWKEKIFGIIKRNITILIHDIHILNPNAKILFIAPHFPFPQLPADIFNKPLPNIGRSIKQFYEDLVAAMKSSSEFSLQGSKNKFVDFIDIQKLKVTKTTSTHEVDSRDNKGLYFNDYIKKQVSFAKVKNIKLGQNPSYWQRNAFPNSLDIHPSIFGHQLIGNAIFSRIYNYLKIKNQKSEDFYTFTQPYNLSLRKQVSWTRMDEAPNSFDISNQYLLKNLSESKGSFIYVLLKMAEKNFSSQFMQTIITRYLDEFKTLQYEDYIPILELVDDDKMIDALIAILENKDAMLDSLDKIIDSLVSIEIKMVEINKIFKIVNVLSQWDKQYLFKKTIEKVNEFYAESKNLKLKKLFGGIFEFITKPSLISALNLKNVL